MRPQDRFRNQPRREDQDEQQDDDRKRYKDLPLSESERKLDQMFAYLHRAWRLIGAKKHGTTDDDPAERLKKGIPDLVKEVDWALSKATSMWAGFKKSEKSKAAAMDEADEPKEDADLKRPSED